MKFILNPTLEHMTIVKIVTSVWKQHDVRDYMLMQGFQFYYDFNPNNVKWKKIEEEVVEKVLQLSQPQLFEEKLLRIIKPIGAQILEWMTFHYRYFHICLPNKICWTAHGTIDRKKTAELLIKDETVPIFTRYELACSYCLEKDIHEFLKIMPEDLKKSHLDKALPHGVDIWSGDMKKRGESNTHFSNQYNFEYFANTGENVAVEYFLQKLTPKERKKSLVKTAVSVVNTDIFYFLFSEMDEDQQIKISEMGPFRVLHCFLQWPRQRFFFAVANRMWGFISKDTFDYILTYIINKVADGYIDWNYQKLFREFWQESPNTLKSIFIDELYKCRTLEFLFRTKDKDNIRLIFNDATLTAKEKLIYSKKINQLCQCYIRDNEWDVLELCIRECFPSNNEMLKFKEEFEKRIKGYSVEDKIVSNKHKWDQLFCLSDDSNCKYKRNAEENESSSSKRFRN